MSQLNILCFKDVRFTIALISTALVMTESYFSEHIFLLKSDIIEISHRKITVTCKIHLL